MESTEDFEQVDISTFFDQESEVPQSTQNAEVFTENQKKLVNGILPVIKEVDKDKAEKLLVDLQLDKNMRLSKMSKGMKEKVQLVLVMSRRAKIYILDEPLGGVDPASRDYILQTILTNFDKNATLLISTHMIADIEKILDEVVFIDNGKIVLQDSATKLREKENCSIDELFRRRFYVK